MENPPRETRIQEGLPTPDTLAEVGLRTEEAREAWLQSRKGSRLELRRALWSSAAAGSVVALEAWGVVRGAPFFGWLIPILFTGFAMYFWSCRRRAEKGVSSLTEELRLLELERERLSALSLLRPEIRLPEGPGGAPGGTPFE